MSNKTPTSNLGIFPKIEDNLDYFRQKLGIGTSFDVVLREFSMGRKKVAFLYIDGLVDILNSTLIMQTLLDAGQGEIVPNPLDKISNSFLPFGDVSRIYKLDEAVQEVLTGQVIFIIDGERELFVLDLREYPARDPEESDIEKITRGSRDGFVETMLFNVAMIRRRIRDPGLRAEAYKIGRRTLTDVSLLYIEDIVNPQILNRIKSRLQNIDVDGLPMAEKTVEEFITGDYWNPFPEVRYTERPDVAAVHLMEGHVCIIVDTSPSIIIAPVTFFHHIQHAEEFRQNPIVGAYIRWVRLLGILISVLLVPIWLLLAENPEFTPEFLQFIGAEEPTPIPLFIQFLIANIGLDLIRIASVHTPSPLFTALGLVGGLLIGEIAIEVGLLTPEVLLYIGLIAIGVFATPSWELGLANRLMHIILLLLTGLFNYYGFLAGMVLILVRLVTTRSFGVPYLWPLLPFHAPSIYSVILRKPVPIKGFRPAFLKTQDPDTAPPGER